MLLNDCKVFGKGDLSQASFIFQVIFSNLFPSTAVLRLAISRKNFGQKLYQIILMMLICVGVQNKLESFTSTSTETHLSHLIQAVVNRTKIHIVVLERLWLTWPHGMSPLLGLLLQQCTRKLWRHQEPHVYIQTHGKKRRRKPHLQYVVNWEMYVTHLLRDVVPSIQYRLDYHCWHRHRHRHLQLRFRFVLWETLTRDEHILVTKVMRTSVN